MTHWTFIRHGQSTANAEGWFAGHMDAPLTARGRDEATATREALAALAYDRVLCSDLVRARETAAIVTALRPAPTRVDAALRERHCGQWEGRPVASLVTDIEVLNTFDGRPPGGESLRDVALRALAVLHTHAAPGHVLVVGHGALMRATIGVLDGTPSSTIGAWKPKNCEWTTREADAATLERLIATLRSETP